MIVCDFYCQKYILFLVPVTTSSSHQNNKKKNRKLTEEESRRILREVLTRKQRSREKRSHMTNNRFANPNLCSSHKFLCLSFWFVWTVDLESHAEPCRVSSFSFTLIKMMMIFMIMFLTLRYFESWVRNSGIIDLLGDECTHTTHTTISITMRGSMNLVNDITQESIMGMTHVMRGRNSKRQNNWLYS